MSVDYLFQFDIAKQNNSKLTSVDIIKCYLEAGWSLYSEKKQIIYTDERMDGCGDCYLL